MDPQAQHGKGSYLAWFRGKTQGNLDAKGRLTLPQRWHNAIDHAWHLYLRELGEAREDETAFEKDHRRKRLVVKLRDSKTLPHLWILTPYWDLLEAIGEDKANEMQKEHLARAKKARSLARHLDPTEQVDEAPYTEELPIAEKGRATVLIPKMWRDFLQYEDNQQLTICGREWWIEVWKPEIWQARPVHAVAKAPEISQEASA